MEASKKKLLKRTNTVQIKIAYEKEQVKKEQMKREHMIRGDSDWFFENESMWDYFVALCEIAP